MSLILLGILNSQAAAAGAAGAYDLLETQTLGTAVASVTFTGLGSYTDYQHLQLRVVANGASGGSGTNALTVRFNGRTSNYTRHKLYGSGSSVSSSGLIGQTSMALEEFVAGPDTTNAYGGGIIDILDFSNTSKFTTIRALHGVFTTSDKIIGLTSGLFRYTEAVTSIGLDVTGDFNTGSRFSLYGIKGA